MKRVFIFILIIVVTGSLGFKTDQPLVSSVQEIWYKLSLPFQLAHLASQEPDTVLAMPVEGIRVSQVANTWGAPRSGGRSHQGQDIFAGKGTPIYSATPGFVTRVADGGLGGKHVFVTGAGGRRYYYAHLDAFAEIEIGDKVSSSSLLGYVGNTGNAQTTPPHLHFGVYTGAGAINPLPLLANRDELNK